VDKIHIAPDETREVSITLSSLPKALAGYKLSVEIADPVATFVEGSVSFANQATLKTSNVNGEKLTIQQGFIQNLPQPKSDELELATVTIEASQPGEAEVGITVQQVDGQGGTVIETQTEPGHVTVQIPGQSPEPAIAADPSNPATGQTVTFDASGTSDPDDAIASYTWTVDGEQVGTGATLEHAFDEPGAHTVTLAVADEAGNEASTERAITVESPNEAPSAAFTPSSGQPSVGESVTFDASESSDPDGSIASYTWSIDGPKAGTGATIEHVFDSTGTHTVQLRVTDETGSIAKTQQTVTVQGVPPNAALDLPATVDEGASFELDATPTTDPEEDDKTVSWSIVSGNADAVTAIPGDCFRCGVRVDQPGNYTFQVTVTDDDGSDTARQTVNVRDVEEQLPVFEIRHPTSDQPAKVSTQNPGTLEIELLIGRDTADLSPEELAEAWSSVGTIRVGDHQLSPSAIHTGSTNCKPCSGPASLWTFVLDPSPLEPGTHPVRIEISELAKGEPGVDQEPAAVEVQAPNQPPTAAIGLSNGQPETGDTFTLGASNASDPDGEIVDYEWTVDGEEVGSGPSITHDFATPGQHSIQLQVADNAGATATTSRTVTVSETDLPPRVAFQFAPSNPTTGETVSFDASLSTDPDGEISSCRWIIDGTEAGRNATFENVFETPGDHSIELVATDDDGTNNQTTRTISVREPADPTAQIQVGPPAPRLGQTVTLDGSQSMAPEGEIAGYAWTIDDAQAGDGSVIEHAFDRPGNHEIELEVETVNGRTATASESVTVRAPQPTLTVTDVQTRIGDTVRGEVRVDRLPNGLSGYAIQLAVDDGARFDAEASSIPFEGNMLEQVETGNDPRSLHLRFGDIGGGVNATNDPLALATFAMEPTTAGETEIGITVDQMDADGGGAAIDPQTETGTLTVDESTNREPIPHFSLSPAKPRTGQTTTFNAFNTTDPDGSIASYQWTIDEETAGSGPSIEHTFTQPGTHNVRLTVTDTRNRSDATTREITVTKSPQSPPRARVEVDPSLVQPGEPVTITPTASDPDGRVVQTSLQIANQTGEHGNVPVPTRVDRDHPGLAANLVDQHAELAFHDADDSGDYDLHDGTGDPVYLDLEGNGEVAPGDVRLTSNQGLTLVNSSDEAVGLAIEDLDAELAFVDANGDEIRNRGEAIVVDTDANRQVDVGDVPLAGADIEIGHPVADGRPLHGSESQELRDAAWTTWQTPFTQERQRVMLVSEGGHQLAPGDIAFGPSGQEIVAPSSPGVNAEYASVDAEIAFVDANANDVVNSNEPVVLDLDRDGEVSPGDVALAGDPFGGTADSTEATGQALTPLDDPRLAYHDADGDGAASPNDPLYLDVGGAALDQVESGDVRLAHPDRESGSRVDSGANDVGHALEELSRAEIVAWDVDGDGTANRDPLYIALTGNREAHVGDARLTDNLKHEAGTRLSIGDAETVAEYTHFDATPTVAVLGDADDPTKTPDPILLDTDGDHEASPGDVRLTGSAQGTFLAPGDALVGRNLEAAGGLAFVNEDADDRPDPREPMYLDLDETNRVSSGDARLTPAANHAAGSRVDARASDRGQPLTRLDTDVRYWDNDRDGRSSRDPVFVPLEDRPELTVGDLRLTTLTPEQNPLPGPVTRAFGATGDQEVRFTVTNDEGLTATASAHVQVRRPSAPGSGGDGGVNLTVDLTGPADQPTVEKSVRFEADVDPSEADVTEYTWAIDGENVTTGPSLEYSFPEPGRHTVHLTANGPNATSAQATRTVNVASPNQPPVPEIHSPAHTPRAGQAVTLASDSHDIDGTIVEHTWNLDEDPEPEHEGPRIQRSFAPGVHPITLTVTDDNGTSASTTLRLPVARLPHGDLGLSATTDVQLPLKPGDTAIMNARFVATGAANPSLRVDTPANVTLESVDEEGGAFHASDDELTWSQTGTKTPTFELTVPEDADPGRISVTLTARAVSPRTGDTLGRETTVDLPVAPSVGDLGSLAVLQANSRPEPGDTVNVTLPSAFEANEARAIEWRFGDDANATGAQAEHVFDQPGTYPVTVNVTGPDGTWQEATTRVEVRDRTAPTVHANPNRTRIPAGEGLTANATATDDRTLSSITLRLIDGDIVLARDTVNGNTTARIQPADLAYGEYTLEAIAVDEVGNVDTHTREIYVQQVHQAQTTVDPGTNATLVDQRDAATVRAEANNSSSARVDIEATVSEGDAALTNDTQAANTSSEDDTEQGPSIVRSLSIYEGRNHEEAELSRINLTLHYNQQDLTDLVESEIAVHYWNGQDWANTRRSVGETIPHGGPYVYEAGVVPGKNLAYAVVNHTSTYGLGGNPDTVAPQIGELTPQSQVENTGPTIAAHITDSASGVDPDQSTLRVDANTVDATLTGDELTFTPSGPLDEGHHTATVTAVDEAGNEQTHTWSFTVEEPSVTGGGGGGLPTTYRADGVDEESDDASSPESDVDPTEPREPSTPETASPPEDAWRSLSQSEAAIVDEGRDRVAPPGAQKAQLFEVPVEDRPGLFHRIEVQASENATGDLTTSVSSSPTGTDRSLPPGFQIPALWFAVASEQAVTEVRTVGLRLGVQADHLAGVDPGKGVVLRAEDGGWEPVPTSLVGTGEDKIVYDARVTEFGAFAFALDHAPPRVSLESPNASAHVKALDRIELTYDDNRGIDRQNVTVRLDGQPIEPTPFGDTPRAQVEDLAADEHEIQVHVLDHSGHRTNEAWTFTIQEEPGLMDRARQVPSLGGAMIAVLVALSAIACPRRHRSE